MAYEIGDTVYFKGTPYTVTSEPRKFYGAWWQDAENASGTVTIPTPEQAEANVARKRSEWDKQQAAFRRLKKSVNE